MNRNVLFVDDDTNMLDSLKRALHQYSRDWHVVFLESGQKAIEHLSSHPCDIVVTDYKMPDMNGLELLKQVMKDYPGVKRVLLTGQSESETYDHSKGIVHEYIAKPCDWKELVERLESLL